MLHHFWTRYTASRYAERFFVGAVIFILLVLAGVAKLSGGVLAGDTQAFDDAVIAFFHGADGAVAKSPWWLRLAMGDITALGSHTVLGVLTLLAGGYCLLLRRYSGFFFLLLSFAGALLLNSSLKELVGRERPPVIDPLAEVLTLSYPSGHALMSAAMYLSFAFLLAEITARRSARAYLITAGGVLAGVIGFSRIYLGVHYPTDIIAGWAIGTVWAMTCWLGLRQLARV